MSKTVPVEPSTAAETRMPDRTRPLLRHVGRGGRRRGGRRLAGEGWPAGSGTQSDPYAISTRAFAWWAAYKAADAGTFARLDADVDLTTDKHAARESAGNGSGERAEATEGSDEPDRAPPPLSS
ncbi:MAG: hypothetical protein ACLSVD_08785 [Eggerthellaceae bacterium]